MIDLIILYHFVLQGVPGPVDGVPQRWLAVFRGQILFNLGQGYGQMSRIDYLRKVPFVINRKGFTPVSLSRKNCISQSVIDLSLTYFSFLQLPDDHLYRFFCRVAADEIRIGDTHIFIFAGMLGNINILKNVGYLYPEMFGKIVIALISAGYGHNSTGTVARQNIITYPDRHRSSCKRMFSIGSGKLTCDGFNIRHPVPLTSF